MYCMYVCMYVLLLCENDSEDSMRTRANCIHVSGGHSSIYIYIERERELERECVYERERVCVCVFMRERVCVCMRERESVCARV